MTTGLSRVLLNVYPLDLGATEAQQLTISSLCMLPCTFKIIFGFISDTMPFLGYRRKTYMALGWLVTMFSMILLIAKADLTLLYDDDDRDSVNPQNDSRGRIKSVPPEGAPSMELLSLCFLLFGTGFWFADVMGDSIVAEKAKLEPEGLRGQLQSTCYACRFFGLMVAAPCSTIMYSTYGPISVVTCMAVIPMAMFPLVYFLWEQKNVNVKRMEEHCPEIWKTVCSRAVWQPMGFVYLYNLLQVSNAAWRQFLKSVLGFTANELNMLLIAAYALLYAGTLAYKYYFIRWSWRFVYKVGILLNGVFSLLQLLLIKGVTFGLSPFLFALGDDAFAEFIVGVQFLPTTIMMVHLCPDGSEGASYAMFTTVNNAAMLIAPAISTMLLGIWDVSKETMEAGNLSGMMKLTLLTTTIQTSAVLFVKLLPKSRGELYRLNEGPYAGSKIGGFVVLAVVFSSIIYSTVVGILNIVKPVWAGQT